MAANVYECLFLLDANKVGGDLDGAVKQLEGILTKHQAEILASRPWSDRRLAYAINGQKKGLYYLTYFRMEGRQVPEIEKDCHLNESILRWLVIKLEHPKLIEAMLQVAQEDRVEVALQSVTDPPDDGLGDEGRDRDRGGRREYRGRD